MLKKIYRVQKSYRITAEIDEKITLLSKYLNKPQNDIVNVALEELFKDTEIKEAYENALALFGNDGGDKSEH